MRPFSSVGYVTTPWEVSCPSSGAQRVEQAPTDTTVFLAFVTSMLQSNGRRSNC